MRENWSLRLCELLGWSIFLRSIIHKSKKRPFILNYDIEEGITLMNQGVTLLHVERARRKLYQVQKKYGFLTHPKVVEQSKKLDDLLNHYQTCKSES